MDENRYREFCEMQTFTVNMQKLLSYEEYHQLQLTLVNNPEAGEIMPGTGGFRKLRFALQGGGKRGGARVIYYWFDSWDRIYLVYIYKKGKKDSLTQAEKKALQRLAGELKKEPVPIRPST